MINWNMLASDMSLILISSVLRPVRSAMKALSDDPME